MENYWHICTDGLAKNVIFKDRADYIFGMNSIPVCALTHGVTLLAFCLMSNHVHFVVQGTEELSLRFIRAYRRRLSSIADVSAADICMKRIDKEEYLMQVIGYVLRNPLPAGLKVLPIFYEWSSASLYFSGGNPSIPGDRLYSTLTFKEQRKLIKSHAEIPGHFCVSPDGLIRPACYVDYEAVENLFGAPGRLLYRLSRNDDAELELNLSPKILKKSNYMDSELTGTVAEVCKQEFDCTSPQELSVTQRYRLADILRKSLGLGIKQLARLTQTDPKVLNGIMRGGREEHGSERKDIATD